MQVQKARAPSTSVILRISAFLTALLIVASAVTGTVRNRVIILTDISPPEQEPDDVESMVRLLMYSNELDIEGFIATSSCWRKNDPLRPDLITSIINAYGKVRPNLLLHAPGYPVESDLMKFVKEGNGHGMAATGSGKTTSGSELIVTSLGKVDKRPLWICIWGGAATLAQALYDLKANRPAAQVDSCISRLRICDLSGQDDAGAWICNQFPTVFYIRSRLQWRGFSYRIDGLWTDSRGGDETFVAPEWFRKNIFQDHGVLGALYPPAKYLYEGDSPTFLNLVSTGLTSEPDAINYGGWGGRFEPDKKKNVRTGSDTASVIETAFDDYWMFTDATDIWSFNGVRYNNEYSTIFRWREACQNDFAARMDWCVRGFAAANHPPRAVVNGDTTSGFIRIVAQPGSRVELDASGTHDPDGDTVHCSWQVYAEAGTYSGGVDVSETAAVKTTVVLPLDCVEKEFHLILSVRDVGTPNLFAFRRIILSGRTATDARYFSVSKYYRRGSGQAPKVIGESNVRVSVFSLMGRKLSAKQYIQNCKGHDLPGVYCRVLEGAGRGPEVVLFEEKPLIRSAGLSNGRNSVFPVY